MVTKASDLLESDTTAVSVSHIDRLYIQRALDGMIQSNERSVKKEISGSAFVEMRNRETEMLRALRSRFGV